MADVVQIIDEFIEDVIAAGSPDAHIQEEWIPWCERELRRGARRVWDAADWDFRFGRDAAFATVANAKSVILPADFLRFPAPDTGGIFIPGANGGYRGRLTQRPLAEVESLQLETPYGYGGPTIYAVGRGATQGRDYLYYSPYSPSTAYTIPIVYEKKQAAISYDDAEGLEDWPDDVADLLYIWLEYRYEKKQGNGQEAGEAKGEFYEQLKQHASRQQQNKATIKIVGDEGLSELGMW
jgi:hypothetical protein